MLPYQEFFTSIKGIAIIILVAIVLFFLLFREINKQVSEKENETIEINDIDVPTPSSYDAQCVRVTGRPCPTERK
jgi:flagellar biosynthesis/type III secretory pathway M-ring protein FliF/YscJ